MKTAIHRAPRNRTSKNRTPKDPKPKIVLVIACAILFAVVMMTASPGARQESAEGKKVRALYLERAGELQRAVDVLDREARTIVDGTNDDPEDLRAAFRAARIAYKRFEVLVAFFDRFAASKMNGVPLPKVDESDPARSVIDPEGFQTLEEIVFSDEPGIDPDELLRLTERLRHRARKTADFSSGIFFADRYLFEAMREEVLRVMTLGVTGFDSPVALESLPEAVAALEGTRDLFLIFEPRLRAASPAVAGSVTEAFDVALAHVRNGRDFDSFDRLEFIRDKAVPLYASLLTAHRALGIRTWEEEVDMRRALRYEAANPFEPSAFDPFFYSSDRYEIYVPEQREVGRLLFFDPILSENLERTCASCHDPQRAFTDGLATSRDISSSNALKRNAPTLVNAVFQGKYFWDARGEDLEHQIESVLLNHAEMKMTFEEILERLRKSPEYRERFAAAFAGTSDTAITKFGVTKALATYVRTLVALDSPFDRYVRGATGAIDPDVRRGFNLFMGKAKCGTCHFAPLYGGTVPPLFVESEVEILGVPSHPDLERPTLDADQGRFDVFGDEIHRLAFKTPTVRNAELTAPYMHNGVFRTLEEVVEFYDRGGGAGLGLDVPNQTLPPDRLDLTAEEKRDLVAFMRSLTDTAGTTARPAQLPSFPSHARWNDREVGGRY